MMFKPPSAFVGYLIDNGFPRHRPVEQRQNIAIHYLDLSSLRILAGPFTPFVILNTLPARPALAASELEAVSDEVLQLRTSLGGEFVVLLVGSRIDAIPVRLMTRLRARGVVILDAADFETIEALSDEPDARDRRLVEGLIRFLGRAALSPYEHGQPAFGERFFGRKEEITKALHARGVATLAGCRRIGKTSMLREISRRLRSEFGERLRTADIDATEYTSPSYVLSTIIEQLFAGQPDVERIATDPDLERKFSTFVRMLPDRVPRENPRLEIAVFIDEFDHLLELDSASGYRILKILRSAFQGRPHCRLFLAGFRRVIKELSNATSELHNFGKPIELEGLSRVDATTMIQKPLRMLGVDVGPEHVSLIYQETKGRPELIQLFCGELVSEAEASGELLTTEELMARVVSSSAFRAKISGTFFSNATPLEQLLSYLLVARWERSRMPIEEFEFGVADADYLLMQSHVELDVMQIDQLLGNLRLLSVIERVPGAVRYRLAVPAFANYLLAQDIKYLIRKTLRVVSGIQTGGWSAAALS